MAWSRRPELRVANVLKIAGRANLIISHQEAEGDGRNIKDRCSRHDRVAVTGETLPGSQNNGVRFAQESPPDDSGPPP